MSASRSKRAGDEDRAARLRGYLAAIGPCVFGRCDCATVCAGWIAAETGMAPRLPRYRSRAQADALIAAHGGLAALFAAEAARLGLAETADPQLGDVGVVALARAHVGVIFAQAGVAYLLSEDRGMTAFKPAAIAAAWTVP